MTDSALVDILSQMKEQLAQQPEQMAQQQRDALAEKIAADQRHREEMDSIFQQINVNPIAQLEYRPQAPNANEVRADKIQKINFNIRKSNRLKPFKVSSECDIKLFLKRFDEELVNMKSMVGLADELTDLEYIPIFRVCLDFAIVERVGQVLVSMGKTWETITKAELLKLMREEFGSRQTDVAEVLKMFGPKRLIKKPDEKVGEFFFIFNKIFPR